jgi:NADH-quinone oxidoreductase subunit N
MIQLDFSSQGHYLVAFLPELILSIWGMVILLRGVSQKHKGNPDVASDLGLLALIGVLVAALANGWLYGVTEVGTGNMIAVDRFRLFANWIFLAATGMTILISMGYVQRQRLQAGEFYGLMLYSTVGMMVMAAARDLIVIFMGLEIMSVAVYAMTAMNRRDRKSAEAGLKYFILGAFATGFLLYGIALTYGATGSTNIQTIAAAIGTGAAHGGILLFGVALLAVGFAFKVSAVPFHMWTPDVYEGAPTPVTAFMSVAVKAAAFITFLRVFSVAFTGVYESWWAILWWLSVITMVTANLIALVQVSVKRMLAYSSIAHGGYLLVALVAANDTAAAGLLFYLLIYTLMNIGAFAVVMVVADHGEEKVQIEDYAGFGAKQPILGVVLTVFLLSLAGFPGTGGFMGKIFLLQGAMDANLIYLSVILVLTTVVSYWYYLRVAWFMWMRDAATPDAFSGTLAPMPLRLALVLGVAVVIFTGIFPGAALEMAQASVEGLSSVGSAVAGVMP